MAVSFPAQTEAPRFSIGSAFRAGFRTIGRGLLPFSIGIVGISVLQFTAILWVVERMLGDPTGVPPWANWALVVTNTMGDALLNAFLTGLALSILEDDRPDWRRAVANLPRAFLPVALLSGTYAMLARFGVLLMPHLALLPLLLAIGTFTWLYSGAVVREGGGPLSALRHNLRLSEGHRWRILAMLVIVLVLYFVLAFSGGLLLGTATVIRRTPVSTEAALSVDLVATQLLNALSYIIAAASYHLLRLERHGERHAAVADVFD